jgi:hypothetical protein
MLNQAQLNHWNTPVTGTALTLFLFKAKAHVCTSKMAKEGLSAYFVFSHVMSQPV